MPMPQLKRQLNFKTEKVSSGATIPFEVPLGGTIDQVRLSFLNNGSAATIANIRSSFKYVTVTINGKTRINCLLSQLIDLQEQLSGNKADFDATSNVVNLNLGRLMYNLEENKDFYSWGTSGVSTIQVILYAGTVTDITEVNLTTERRDVVTSLGSIIEVLNYPKTKTTTGEVTIDSIARNPNSAFLQFRVYDGGGAITQGECIAGNDSVYNPVSKAIADSTLNERGYKANPDTFDFMFADGSIRSGLPVDQVGDIQVKVNFATAPTAGIFDFLTVGISSLTDTTKKAMGV